MLNGALLVLRRVLSGQYTKRHLSDGHSVRLSPSPNWQENRAVSSTGVDGEVTLYGYNVRLIPQSRSGAVSIAPTYSGSLPMSLILTPIFES